VTTAIDELQSAATVLRPDSGNIFYESIHIPPQFIQWTKHRRDEERCCTRRAKCVKFLSNLAGRAGQTRIARIGGVGSHTS
jgi:hypothetical protein